MSTNYTDPNKQEQEMARKTSAERRAAAAREQELSEQARIIQETDEYPHRMMALLDRASTIGFNITVENQQFVVADPNNRYGVQYRFTLAYHLDNMITLDSMEYDISIKEDEIAEQRRISELKRVALSKLTGEERQALGI